ncbi:MAG: helix-turn-helix transcriptional regulator [Rhodoluna sp.]
MPKLKGFNGEDRYNFLLSLVGYLGHRAEVPLDEVAAHFNLEADYVRKALGSLNDATAQIGGFEEWPFYVDIDRLDEGFVELTTASVIDDVPRLSTRQAAAISTGLSYLASLPEFAGSTEIQTLIEKIAGGTSRGVTEVISIAPGSVEAGAEVLRKAILLERAISCEYINRKGEKTTREIEPLRIDLTGGVWYLRGYCPINQGVRNFLIEHMRAIEILERETSEAAREVGDIEDATYVAETTDTTVTVEVTPEAYRLISDFQTVSEPKDVGSGTIRAEIKVGHLPNIGRLVAKYGGAAKVLAPSEARDYVRRYALAALGESSTADDREIE